MTLTEMKNMVKELGLDKFHNPIQGMEANMEVELGTKDEMIVYAVNILKTGTECVGDCYRANIFIFHNDGKINALFNGFNGVINVATVNMDYVTEFVKIISDEDCVTIYETEAEQFSVLTGI